MEIGKASTSCLKTRSKKPLTALPGISPETAAQIAGSRAGCLP
jgi:hypothetical protein